MHKIHSAKNVGQEASNAPELNEETRRVTLIHKKIIAVNKALGMKAFQGMKFEDVHKAEIDSFKKSLMATKETIEQILNSF